MPPGGTNFDIATNRFGLLAVPSPGWVFDRWEDAVFIGPNGTFAPNRNASNVTYYLAGYPNPSITIRISTCRPTSRGLISLSPSCPPIMRAPWWEVRNLIPPVYRP